MAVNLKLSFDPERGTVWINSTFLENMSLSARIGSNRLESGSNRLKSTQIDSNRHKLTQIDSHWFESIRIDSNRLG